MAEIRILNGDVARLRRLLGDLANRLEMRAGDAVLVMDTEDQVAVGRAVFERLLTEGHVAFSVEKGAGGRARIDSYDPAEHPFVVMVAPLAGG